MQYDSKRGQHTKLVLKMADKQGIDLAELVMRSEFSPEDMEDAVDKCLGCLHPEDCAHVLESNAESLSLPEYCRNSDLFERLKAQ